MPETVYFVTGASRGIGHEFINQLLKRTDSIVYAGVRNPSSLKDHFPSPPENLHIVQCDVTSDESVTSAANSVAKGPGRVDVLINNAGIDHPFGIKETTVSAFRDVLETNVIGVHRMIRTFLPLMESSSVKKVINISSDFGSVALNDRSFAGAYNTSKAALNMLTVQYKNEYADQEIIFIPLHPGDVLSHYLKGLMVGIY
jgi:NAD(P)-dependent dehydrogenase (short-subunit alcohol dehydrogenase family)